MGAEVNGTGERRTLGGGAIAALVMVPSLFLGALVSTATTTAVTTAVSAAAGGVTSATSCSTGDKDDGREGSDSGGGNPNTAQVNLADIPNARKLAETFADKGYSMASTAGVMGNIQWESGGTWTTDVKEAGGGGGFGLNQWTPRSVIQAFIDSHAEWKGHQDTEVEVQIAMLLEAADHGGTGNNGFNNYYADVVRQQGYEVEADNPLSLWNLWVTAKDPKQASAAWNAGYGRPAANAMHFEERADYAQQFYDQLKSSGITFGTKDGEAPSGTDAGAGGDSDANGGTSTSTKAADCGSDESSGGSAKYGEVGGAPTDTHDFGWMCDTPLKICRDGDYGAPPLDWAGDYQCYWYWLARAWLVHDGKVYNPHTALGGTLADDYAAQNPGKWVKLSDPRPGAGVCFLGANNNHVAFVEKVEDDPSGWKIFISEGNAVDGSAAGHWNEYNTRWMTKAEYQTTYEGNGFIWNNEW